MAVEQSRLVAPAFPTRRATVSLQTYEMAKRLLDVLVAGIALILFAPLMLVIAVAIKLDSPGPAIFVQQRVGRHGRIFNFYKFRSMRVDPDNDRAHRRFAEAYINGESLEDLIQRDAPIYKPNNGNNVTRVGKFLRATSLDELPQLFNVLKGDMSLVGPRPSIYYEVDLYKEWHRRRLDVLPGITGYAQINGRSSLRFDEIVRLDIEYIEKRSFWLDISILLRTIPVVLSTRSAR
ncbi:MAG: sugar transferase [Anaerolineae bacterium]|nr:sugar transferase [Anaerolineae bacterium]